MDRSRSRSRRSSARIRSRRRRRRNSRSVGDPAVGSIVIDFFTASSRLLMGGGGAISQCRACCCFRIIVFTSRRRRRRSRKCPTLDILLDDAVMNAPLTPSESTASTETLSISAVRITSSIRAGILKGDYTAASKRQ